MWDMLMEPWQVGLKLTWKSYCDGYIPIESIIVDAEENIISLEQN